MVDISFTTQNYFRSHALIAYILEHKCLSLVHESGIAKQMVMSMSAMG